MGARAGLGRGLSRVGRWRSIDERLGARQTMDLRRRVHEMEELVAEHRRLDARAEELMDTLVAVLADLESEDPRRIEAARAKADDLRQ